MNPPGISVNQSQSMSDVARILREPKRDSTSAMTREFRDAAAHRQRDNGSMGLFMDSKKNLDYVSPRPAMRRPASTMSQPGRDGGLERAVEEVSRQPRLHGTASLENERRSRNGEVSKLLTTVHSENTSLADKPRPRVTNEEAEQNFNKHRVGTMKDILNVDANKHFHDSKSRDHNLTKEAKENHAKHTGASMAGVLTHPNPGASSVGGSEIQFSGQTRKYRQPDTCSQVIRGEVPGDTIPEARVKYAGKDIYEKNRGTLTSLIAEYGRTASDLDRPHMKRCDDKRMEGSMKGLLEGYGKPLPKSTPSYRVRTPDARRFAKTSAGSSMTNYFSDTKSYKTNSYHKWPNY